MTRSYSGLYALARVGATLAGSGLDQVIVCARCGEPLELPVEREHCPGAAALALKPWDAVMERRAASEEAAVLHALNTAMRDLEYAHDAERRAQFEVNMNFLDRAHLFSTYTLNAASALISLAYAIVFAGLYFHFR